MYACQQSREKEVLDLIARKVISAEFVSSQKRSLTDRTVAEEFRSRARQDAQDAVALLHGERDHRVRGGNSSRGSGFAGREGRGRIHRAALGGHRREQDVPPIPRVPRRKRERSG